MAAVATILDFRSKRFLLFFIYKLPRYIQPSFESTGFWFRRRRAVEPFKTAVLAATGFPFETCSYFFIQKLPANTSYQASSPSAFDSGEEALNIFSRWPPRRPSWISNQNFSYFLFTSCLLILTIKFRVKQPFDSGEDELNVFSRWQP